MIHETKISGIELSEKLDYHSRFPQFLKDRAEILYSVSHRGKYIGEVYYCSESWRAFTVCVSTDTDGTLDSCIRALL